MRCDEHDAKIPKIPPCLVRFGFCPLREEGLIAEIRWNVESSLKHDSNLPIGIFPGAHLARRPGRPAPHKNRDSRHRPTPRPRDDPRPTQHDFIAEKNHQGAIPRHLNSTRTTPSYKSIKEMNVRRLLPVLLGMILLLATTAAEVSSSSSVQQGKEHEAKYLRNHRRLPGDYSFGNLQNWSSAQTGFASGLLLLLFIIFILYCCCGCSICEILMVFCCYEMCCDQ